MVLIYQPRTSPANAHVRNSRILLSNAMPMAAAAVKKIHSLPPESEEVIPNEGLERTFHVMLTHF
jgi:hypothetical protein